MDAVDACTAGDVKSGLTDVQALGACRTLDQERRRGRDEGASGMDAEGRRYKEDARGDDVACDMN